MQNQLHSFLSLDGPGYLVCVTSFDFRGSLLLSFKTAIHEVTQTKHETISAMWLRRLTKFSGDLLKLAHCPEAFCAVVDC